MKKTALALLMPLFLYSDSLKDLIEHAQNSNELLRSNALKTEVKAKELQSSESGYFPTFDIGATYKRDDEPQPFSSGTTYSGFAKLSLDIYKGGAKIQKSKQKRNELSASTSLYEASKKATSLEIAQNFYALKSLEATLEAQEESSRAVGAQLRRMGEFAKAGLATSDDVDRLQAAYDKTLYAIESLKFQVLSTKKELELQTGKEISELANSEFKKFDQTEEKTLESIKALEYQKSSLDNAAKIVASNYYPQVKLEDTYSFYGYQDKPVLPAGYSLLDKQNTLLVTANMRLFDFGAVRESKEALELEARALESEIAYKIKEQAKDIALAKERITTAKLNIQSSQSALKASKSALETITQKYKHKIVDNVVYLDALSAYTEAKASYHKALNDLEVAYALYYFYNGENLEEYLDE